MQSLFNPSHNLEMITRIYRLHAGTKPLWGKMTVAQMLAHLQMPLLVSFGELKIKNGLMGLLFGKMAKKTLMEPGPFKNNLPTVKNFRIKDERNFEEERDKLALLIKRYASEGEKALTKLPHPFFGRLTTHEWNTLQWKHLDHHLRQFGV